MGVVFGLDNLKGKRKLQNYTHTNNSHTIETSGHWWNWNCDERRGYLKRKGVRMEGIRLWGSMGG